METFGQMLGRLIGLKVIFVIAKVAETEFSDCR